MSRALYRWLLYWHPPAFRDRFADEMLSIFDEAAAIHGVRGLFVDGIVSLLRQWTLRPESWKSPVALSVPVSSRGPSTAFLSSEDFEIPAHNLPLRRWIEGIVMTLGLLSAVWSLTGGGGYKPATLSAMFNSRRADIAQAAASISPENSETEFTSHPAGEGSYAASGAPEGLREHQVRQQERALRIAIGGRNVPGSLRYVVNSRGAVVETPKTAAGEQFAAWLKAFNSGERAQVEAFLSHYKDPSGHEVNGTLGFRQQTGGFELRKIEESTPARISGLVQESDSDQFARFTMEVEAEEPHRIAQFDLRAVPRPAEFPVERLSESALLAALREKLEKDSAADKFAGAVLVARGGKAIFTGAYGMADREKKIPNALDTKFRIGSMNKMFTATSILQLVQTGKIKLTDPFGKYITDYPNKDAAAKATIEQLLTHTGGTGDIFGPEFTAHREGLRTLQDYVNLYGKRDLEFAPGSRWEYSNYGFLLLGVVVERVSGKSYYDYVDGNIYGPAGMTGSGSLTEEQNVSNRSTGYTRSRGEALHPNTDTLPYRGTSAGGGYSTVEDLLRFANALTNHKLLNAQYTEMLTTGKVDTPRGLKYAFGFMADNTEGVPRHFGHGGGAPGMNGELEIYPQNGYVIAVLANLDPPAASRVSDFVENRLPKD
jgi:CubicO group peptidase (beta-lactamase class C family)